MPERNRGRIVKTKLEFRTVVQPNHLTARPDVTTVRGLTAISGGDRFDVIRPAPTWLERALAHSAISDPHDRPEESAATARTTAVAYVRGPVAGGLVATDGSATDVVIGAVLEPRRALGGTVHDSRPWWLIPAVGRVPRDRRLNGAISARPASSSTATAVGVSGIATATERPSE